MTPKHLFVLLLALFATSVAQTDNELHIPEENDNQFPPVNHSELDLIPVEGSGEEEFLTSTPENAESPPLENVQLSSTLIHNENVPTSDKHTCPTKCICNIEGDSDKYVVDCSDAELTELPKALDPKTTELNLRNNKLTVISKDISELKNLKILNANNNLIMDVEAGSISELSQLITLKLENNRLVEYPKDLKNGFGLTKLEEFDLGGNDMRTVLKSEIFSMFTSLRKLTLPSASPDLVDDLCAALKESLVTVCTESCNIKSYDCPDAPDTIDDLDIVIPALLPSPTDNERNEDLITSTDSDINKIPLKEESVQTLLRTQEETSNASSIDESRQGSITGDAVSFRSAVIKATGEEIKPRKAGNADSNPVEVDSKPLETAPQPPAPELNQTEVEQKTTGVEQRTLTEERKNTEAAPNSNIMSKTEGEVAGSTTASAKSGGVDKSIIGIIVAGMVLVVAGITIKKNWSSIRNRFSSSPRNANDRTGINTNGTAAPEEVPLQEKSPV